MYKEITGNLITLALKGEYDVIAQGCNCFCIQGSGLAPQMVEAFGTDQFLMEGESYVGDINKLGTIDYESRIIKNGKALSLKGVPRPVGHHLTVVNAYTQYDLGRNHKDGKSAPVDYEAISLCMKKINHIFKGKHIGLPQIGSGLAGGSWAAIKNTIQTELTDCDVTVVIYDNPQPVMGKMSKLFKS